MKLLRLDVIRFDTNDIQGAMKFWSELLDIKFDWLYTRGKPVPNRKVRDKNGNLVDAAPDFDYAIAELPGGVLLDLCQPAQPVKEGFTELCFTVDNFDEGIAHFRKMGLRVKEEIHPASDYRAVIFNPEDSYGVQVLLNHYDREGDNLRDAIKRMLSGRG